MRLHVRMIGAEQLLRSIDGELLDLIDELAPAVVPFSWKPFGVLVGEGRTHGLEHGFGDEVLAGDQLDAVALPLDLTPDHCRVVRRVFRLTGPSRPLDI